MNTKTLTISAFVVGLVVLASALLFGPFLGLGAISSDIPSVTVDTQRNYEFFASTTAPSTVATTTSATSTNIVAFFDTAGRKDNGYFVIAGAEEVTFYFSRGGATSANTGVSRFEVEVSDDGTNWYDFNKLVLNDVSGTGTTTASIVAATSTTIASMDLSNHAFYAVRCIVVETTDGEHRCRATAEF